MRCNPCIFFCILDFFGLNQRFISKRQPNRIKPLKEATTTERINLKGPSTIFGRTGLRHKIHCHGHAWVSGEHQHEVIHSVFGELHKQKAIAKTIVAKNIRKTERNDRANTVVKECPRSMFAA